MKMLWLSVILFLTVEVSVELYFKMGSECLARDSESPVTRYLSLSGGLSLVVMARSEIFVYLINYV